MSRLQEAQVKYKNAVKQTRNSLSSDDSNTRRSRRTSSNVTHNDNATVTATTSITKPTGCSSRPRSPRDSRVSLNQQHGDNTSHRPSLLTGHHRMVVPSASLNSAFWSSTSSDRRSTTSSLQSVQSVFRGAVATFGKTAISRTNSAGPAMRGIQEEDTEFWQLLQHQQTTGDDDERGRTSLNVRRPGATYRSPVAGIKASFSRSCPCLSPLAAVTRLESVLFARHEQLSPDNDDVDTSKHRRCTRMLTD